MSSTNSHSPLGTCNPICEMSCCRLERRRQSRLQIRAGRCCSWWGRSYCKSVPCVFFLLRKCSFGYCITTKTSSPSSNRDLLHKILKPLTTGLINKQIQKAIRGFTCSNRIRTRTSGSYLPAYCTMYLRHTVDKMLDSRMQMQ